MGLAPHQLAASLPEGEFVRLQQYAAHKLLPQRRIELLLAQIAMLVDHGLCGGGRGRTLEDYLMFDGGGSENDDDDPFDFQPTAQAD